LIISTDLSPWPSDALGEEGAEPGADQLEQRQLLVGPGLHGWRLDRALAQCLPEFSRSYLQQRIEAGDVRLGALCAAKSAVKVRQGQQVEVTLRPTPQSQAFTPQDLPIETVYADEHIRVVNKPAGLVVHPAPGNWQGTLLNGLLALDPVTLNLPRAGIVHRLDKDTSGLMVVARSRAAMDALVRMIAAREVGRQYLALGHRRWSGPSARVVEAAIGRDPLHRLRMAVVDLTRHPGKSARTDFQCLDQHEEACLVLCRLHTGRTHQIRVHMASIGHPLLADALYGGAAMAGMQRQALHAWRLDLNHPVTGQSLHWQSEIPTDMQLAMQELGLRYNGQE